MGREGGREVGVGRRWRCSGGGSELSEGGGEGMEGVGGGRWGGREGGGGRREGVGGVEELWWWGKEESREFREVERCGREEG